MTHSKAITALAFLTIFAGSCSKDAPLPLTAGECKQMKDKQLQLMVAALPKEYQSSLEGAKLEVEIDCDNLQPNARIDFECTMSSSTMNEFDQCRTEKYKQ